MVIRSLTRSLIFACAAALSAAPALARPILELQAPAKATTTPAFSAAGGVTTSESLEKALEEETSTLATIDAPPSAAEVNDPAKAPYKALIDDMLDGQLETEPSDTAIRPQLDKPSPQTLLYGEKQLRQRAKSIRDELSALFEDPVLEGETEEMRELRLRQEIAMKAAYAGPSATQATPDERRANGSSSHSDPSEQVAREAIYLRFTELALFIWDTLTHPVAISIAVLYGLTRALIAIVRMAPKRHRVRRRSRRRPRSRTAATAIAVAAPGQQPEFHALPSKRPRSSRHRRRRRSLLDRLFSF
ncbi:MAG: hypothetical protein KDF24_10780 [Rhodocyclaceae bacterium]|nr:hypothetical protein [Rhodocyclaceae bacterium]MCB1963634.1 hypothetical protein [Rhodocyclaceae bacterium]